MNHQKFMEGYTNSRRDSLMAANIIKNFNKTISKQKRKKALVIMNTRHGYGLIDKRFNKSIKSEYNIGTTAFLMKAFPGKIANVMMNSISIKYGILFTPVQNGKWETAFSILGNPDAGFDFAGSPFGNDRFDIGFFSTPALTYKDVFTGFIFYKPLSQHIKKNGFPHEFDNFEDTILRRAACVSKSNVENLKTLIALYKQNPLAPIFSESAAYAGLYNLIKVFLIPLLLVISYLISLIFFIRAIRKGSVASEL